MTLGRTSSKSGILAALVLAAGALSTAGPAHASTTLLNSIVCTGTVDITLSPGITNTPATVQVTSTTSYTGCLPLGAPAHTSGSSSFSATRTFSCLDLVTPGVPGSKTITWENQAQTKLEWLGSGNTVENTPVANIVIRRGTVTSGDYNGKSFVEQQTLLQSGLLACTTPAGLTHVSGPSVLTVLL